MGNMLCVHDSSAKSDRIQRAQVHFVRALGQIEALDRYTKELQRRLEHAKKNKCHSAKHQLRMKLSVIQPVSDMYLEYASRQLNIILHISSMEGECDTRHIRAMFLNDDDEEEEEENEEEDALAAY